MDRMMVYPGAIPLETDILQTNKMAMVALAKLTSAVLGTATVANGLGCVPTTPAGLTVNVNPGELYSLVNVDATAYSSLAADTTHQIMKSGILMDVLNLSCPAPATAGYSVNYLIQAIYQDSDTTPLVLPYYNASNPSQAYSGPNNSGATNNTIRKGIVTISAKAGVAATTGSQITPAPDVGYVGLWVVTVANGQTTITSINIVKATNAPLLGASILPAIQQNSLVYGLDAATANAYAVQYYPPIVTLTDGMVLWFTAKNGNTGASTLNPNGIGAIPIVDSAKRALQGGEILANGKYQVIFDLASTSFILIAATSGLGIPSYATTPSIKLNNTIYVEDKQCLMQWMTIGAFTGYASPECGAIMLGHTPSPLPYQVLAIGATVNVADYPALYARFVNSGLIVASGSWAAGTYNICDVSAGVTFKLPDLRNMFLRFTGTDVDTANARVLGSKQLDSFKSHAHTIRSPLETVDSDKGGSASFWSIDSTDSVKPTTSVGGSETRGPNTAVVPYLHI